MKFDACEDLGAANLRGSGFAARDTRVHELRSRFGDQHLAAEVNVAGLAGFLLAKTAAARKRRAARDWYDIAFVLLHNEEGGPDHAAAAVLRCFGEELVGSTRTALEDLRANFASPDAQGPRAYVSQMRVDHPDLDAPSLAADAVLAVERFCGRLLSRQDS
ncbi:MAG: nucleotidyl transferase AbiEii/AbiGii toxin family protein [Deltaproteobacteria bacterium]|nr:nucleotidyl transferase AbiEii/AbiGii toxin family protein [Deltaproteobacteria bacterium]